LESSYNNLSNGGSNAVITLHKPKQSYIYSPLGQTFWIWYQDNLEYVLNSSEFASYNISKVLRVFKRFRVENFAWIGPLEIFILNFSICRVFTRTRAVWPDFLSGYYQTLCWNFTKLDFFLPNTCKFRVLKFLAACSHCRRVTPFLAFFMAIA
jgi:hypothetical protein